MSLSLLACGSEPRILLCHLTLGNHPWLIITGSILHPAICEMCFTTGGLREKFGGEWGRWLGLISIQLGAGQQLNPSGWKNQIPKQNCFRKRLVEILGKVGDAEAESAIRKIQVPLERFWVLTKLNDKEKQKLGRSFSPPLHEAHPCSGT